MRNLTLLLIVFTASFSFSQKWGANLRSQYTNEALDVEIDASGNSYITGYVTGETSFDENNSITSAPGNGDVYVAKYDPAGTLIWFRQFGGNFSDRAYDLAIGPDQNIVITGQFFGNISFGSISLSSSAGSKDIFLAKLNPSGNVLWARKEGGSMEENAYGVTVDHQNNVILTGQFKGTATLANQSFTSMFDPVAGQSSFDIFVSKYDAAGTSLWARQGSAEYEDRGMAVAVDSQDNIFLCGQYSDTIQFAGNTYNNNGINAGFICRFSPSGNLDFFNNLRAGQVLPYDLEVNAANEVLVTGDFLGNMNYYDNSGPHSIQNPYSEQVFILKISQGGYYIWNYTLGSDSEFSARSISIDPAQDIFVTGFFRCALSELHDPHPAIWNSVGFRDPYVLKVSNAGAFTYAKQFGGKEDDEGHGVAVTQNDKPVLCGTYLDHLNLVDINNVTPTTPDFYRLNSSTYSWLGENEQEYNYLFGDDSRNSFLLNYIDADYGEYNYFVNYDETDSIPGNIVVPGDLLVRDTVHFCTNLSLTYGMVHFPYNYNYSYNELYKETYPSHGPDNLYNWNTGSTDMGIVINSTGYYYVTVTRNDQCVTDIDSIYAILEPTPQLPLLSDDHGIYTNFQLYPGSGGNPHYYLCYPDSLSITYSNLSPDITSITTTQFDGTETYNGAGPNTFDQAGEYIVDVSNGYCYNSGSFDISYQYGVLDTLDLGIGMQFAQNDSITICEGDYVFYYDIDYFANPAGLFENIPISYSQVEWKINGVSSLDYDSIRTSHEPSASGWYVVELEVLFGYNNLCGIDTMRYYAIDSFYIHVNPLPALIVPIIGEDQACPGGTFLSVANTFPDAYWHAPNWTAIIWQSADGDSIMAGETSLYSYSGPLTDSVTGCEGSFYASIFVTVKEVPQILSATSIICPYDSVLLSLPNTFATYQWIGPNGDVMSVTNSLYGEDQGLYYCNLTDADGCNYITPAFELTEYTTPSLSVTPANFICAGETVTIAASYTGEVGFQWSPIASSADEITVNQPGTYTATMQQCGIAVQESITIIDASFIPEIFADTLICDGSETVVSGTPVNASFFWNDTSIVGSSFSTSGDGTFYATVINQYGCEAETNTITIVSLPHAVHSTLTNTSVCEGNDLVLTDPSGMVVDWYSTDDTTLLYSGTVLNINNIENDTAFIIAFDTETCDQAFDLITITIIDSIPDFSILGDSLLCSGEQAVFTADTELDVEWFIQSVSLGHANPITLTQPLSAPNITAVVANSCFTRTVTDTLIYAQPLTIHLAEDSIILCQYDEYPIGLLENTASVTWTGPFGSVQDPELILSPDLGTGIITAQAIDLNGCTTNSVSFYLASSDLDYEIQSDFSGLCEGNSGFIQLNSAATDVLWETPLGTFDTTYLTVPYTTASSGMYSVTLWDEAGCIYRDSLDVDVDPHPNPEFDLPEDTLLCLKTIFSYPFPDNSNIYSWDVYGQTEEITILESQLLILTATSPFGCIFSDSIQINGVNCESELPNVITSNGDGINDYFQIEEALFFPKNHLVIYNRWGNIIFEADGYKNNFEGSAFSEGVYFYKFSRDPQNDPENVVQGFLHLYH